MDVPLSSQMAQNRPRYGGIAGAVLALLCIGTALAYAVLQQAPRGRLVGQVTRSDSGAAVPFARVVASAPAGTFYARADAKGNYSFTALPTGQYEITAYSRSEAFQVSGAKTGISEAETSSLPLVLARSQPDLQQSQQQTVFLPGEAAFLPVHGYADPNKPKNTDTLQLKIWKTRLSNIMRDSEAAKAFETIARRWNRPATLPFILLTSGINRPKLIQNRALPIREADAEGFYHKRVPLDVKDVGLYLVEIAHIEGKTSRTVCGWVNITNTALVLKKAPNQSLAFVTDLQSGKPLPGVAVNYYDGNKNWPPGRTDANGLWQNGLPSVDNDKLLVVAQRGDDEALLDRGNDEHDNSGDVVTHVYTDRPIYRPGQKISFKGITRKRQPAQLTNDMAGANFVFADTHVKWLKGGSYYANGYVQASATPYQEGKTAALEVRDPSGVRIYSATKPINNFGSFAGDFELSPEAPTGNYSLLTTIDGEETSSDITVAAYRKPEFEVTVTPGKPHYVASEGMSMEIAAKYYFGSPVAGAKVRYSIYRGTDWSAVDENSYEYAGEDYEGYSDYGEFVREGEGVLDENGKLAVNFAARTEAEIEQEADGAAAEQGNEAETRQNEVLAGAPRLYTAQVTVTDAAERSVEGEGKVRLTSGDFTLSVRPEGYVAQPGQPMNLNIVARDLDEKPVANVPISLEMGYWRTDKPENSEAAPKSTFVAVRTQTFTTNANGVAAANVTPPRTGEWLLTARAKDSAGHAIEGSTDLWAAGDGGGDYETGYLSDLSLFTDKKRYAAGETARVLINCGQTGQSVLLTLEGERIYKSWVVPITKRSTIFKVPLDDETGPNVFLAACYVKDKKFAETNLPLRVQVPNRQIKVAIRADKSDYAPGGKISYDVTTADAKGRPVPAEFSFGVVDESIYALREDDPNALQDAFYPRRENNVSTTHSFATEYLGDANKADLKIEPRRKFLDTAFWQPFEHTGPNGTAKISFNLPDNLTKWRATAVAQTQDTTFGYGIQKVTASKDFFVRLEKPRFLTQRDNGQLTAFIHNETGQAQKANVRLTLSGLKTALSTTQEVEVAPAQVGRITWPVSAEKYGDATITLAAWTSDKRLTDALEETLAVRPHGREIIVAMAGQVPGGKPQTETVNLDANAIRGVSRLKVRLTPSLVSSLTGGLEYLTGYPYGCVEQTLSRFMPDLFVSRVLKAQGDNSDRSRRLQGELPKMVRDGFTRLYAMQHESGAWGWWEYDADHPWMTAYVLYGLSVAQKDGYQVDEERFAKGRQAALSMLPTTKGQHRAFLLYALALAAQTAQERAAIAKERGKTDWRGWDGEPLAYLLLADKLLGVSDPKVQAVFEIRSQSADGMTHWQHKPDNTNSWDYDYDDVTATATALRAILARDPKDKRVPGILRYLMVQRTGDYWHSTRDTSMVLAALCDYLVAEPGALNLQGALTVRVNGERVQTFTLSPQMGKEPDLQVELGGEKLRAGANSVTLERTGGSSPVFYSVQLQQTISSEDIKPSSGALKIEREYLRETTPQRNEPWNTQTEATNNQLRQGDRIRVKLTFEVPRNTAYVLIEDAYPAGCEASERGTADEEVNGESWRYGYASLDVSNVDVRDDRIAFFARKVPAGKHTISYHLRAQTPGVYHVMPAQLQAMYDPSLRAESAENRVEVR